jgi:hypothetical protein
MIGDDISGLQRNLKIYSDDTIMRKLGPLGAGIALSV